MARGPLGLRNGLVNGLRNGIVDGLQHRDEDTVELLSLSISPDPGLKLFADLTYAVTASYSDGSTQVDPVGILWSIPVAATEMRFDGGVSPLSFRFDPPAIKIAGVGGWVTASFTGSPITDTAPVVLVANDSGSNAIRMPQSDEQWQVLGLSPWGGWWGCQEGSGSDLVGSGSVPFTLTQKNGAVTARCQWAKPEVDWLRTSIHVSGGGGSNTGWSANAGTGPNIQTTSIAFLGYFLVADVPSNRHFFGWVVGGNGMLTFTQLANGLPRFIASGSTFDGAQTLGDGRLHPILLIKDGTNSRTKFYTDLEKITGSWPSTAFYDGPKGFGGHGTTGAPSGSCVFMAYCTGSVAERFSDDGAASDLLKKLGWQPPW